MKIANKAAVLEKYNSGLKFYKFKNPSLKKGEVLIKNKFTSICRSQLMEISGNRNNKKWLPHMLGHESVGQVIAMNDNCKKFKKGDFVIATWINSLGLKSNGGTLKLNGKRLNYGPITTFSKYSIVSENKLVKKPAELSNKFSPLLGCAIPTGMGIVYNESKPKVNQTILLIGLGGIGYFSLLALKFKNCKNIIVADINNKKKDIAKSFGIKNFFNVNNKNDYLFLKNKYSKKIDICFDNSGKINSIHFGISMLKNTGKLYFTSHPPIKDRLVIDPHELIKGKKIFGSWGGGCKPDRDIPKYAKLLGKNTFWTKHLKSDIYDFNNINKAIRDFKKGKVLRPIIKF
tara:strand:- start:926 stop:1960 length:1035 start_codon:yes stop_codon:yes gene_type:complete